MAQASLANLIKSKKAAVSVIGLGYIGLPTACFLAANGFRVTGVDVQKEKIGKLKKGKLPFKENGLEELFLKARKNLDFSSEVGPAEVFIVAVPTPITPNKKIDFSFVRGAVEGLRGILGEENMVIIESTISPKSSLNVVKPILDRTKKKYHLVHCPERAMPGNTLHEMRHNDRIVGGLDEEATELAAALYRSFVKGKLYRTNTTTAEVVKLVENSFRDVNIAFANELAKICEKLGINVWEVIELANKHPRVNVHLPGPGIGGHCIPVDPWFLTEHRLGSEVIKTARLLNDSMPSFVVQKLEKEAGRLGIKRVGVIGVAYKKNVDDHRESPAKHILNLLQKKNYEVRATDHHVRRLEFNLYPLKDVLAWADAAILITDHDAYRNIDFSKFKNIKLVLDTRNLFGGSIRGGAKLITLGKATNI